MNLEVTFSPAQRRLVALLLVLVTAFVLLLAAVNLMQSRSEHHARMLALVKEREAFNRSIAEVPALKAAIAEVETTKRRSGYFFASGEATAATVKIRATISTIVPRNGGSITRDDVELVAAGDDSPNELRASISFTGDIRSLTRIL